MRVVGRRHHHGATSPDSHSPCQLEPRARCSRTTACMHTWSRSRCWCAPSATTTRSMCGSRRRAPPRCESCDLTSSSVAEPAGTWNRSCAAIRGRLRPEEQCVPSYHLVSFCIISFCVCDRDWQTACIYFFCLAVIISYLVESANHVYYIVVVMCYISCVHVLRYCYDNLFHALGEGHKWTPGA